MLKKTIFAAATIAVSMVAFQPAAQAGDIQIQVHLGGGHWVSGHWGGSHWGGGHWGGGHWDDDYSGGPAKLTCSQGKRKLRFKDYHHIRPTDCHGKFYGYRAIRNGKIFRIRMNAFTGSYSRVFVGYV